MVKLVSKLLLDPYSVKTVPFQTLYRKIKVNISFIPLQKTACRINMGNTEPLHDSEPSAHLCVIRPPLCVCSVFFGAPAKTLPHKPFPMHLTSTVSCFLYTKKARTQCLSLEESDTVKVPHQTEVYSSLVFASRQRVPITGCIDHIRGQGQAIFSIRNMRLLCVEQL